jgi:hypothetical protein
MTTVPATQLTTPPTTVTTVPTTMPATTATTTAAAPLPAGCVLVALGAAAFLALKRGG